MEGGLTDPELRKHLLGRPGEGFIAVSRRQRQAPAQGLVFDRRQGEGGRKKSSLSRKPTPLAPSIGAPPA